MICVERKINAIHKKMMIKIVDHVIVGKYSLCDCCYHTKCLHIDLIEMVQCKAARWVKNEYYPQSSVMKMLNELKWRALSKRRMDANEGGRVQGAVQSQHLHHHGLHKCYKVLQNATSREEF